MKINLVYLDFSIVDFEVLLVSFFSMDVDLGYQKP